MARKPPFSFLIGKKALLLLLLLPIIFFLFFFIYPITQNLVLAFTNKSLYHYYNYEFVGLANFARMFSSPTFYTVLGQTLFWTICTVSLQVIFGLSFAIFFTSPSLKGGNIYRGLLLLPWAVPNVVMIMIWKGMFSPVFGVINPVLGANIPWYTSPLYAFLMIQIVNIWLAYPFLTLLLTGAVQSIPTEIFESAEIWGCSAFQKLRHITLPLVKPILSYGLLMTAATAFTQFPVIWLLTRGGPGGSTDVLMTWAYKEAFANYNYGYHAAITMFGALISIIFAIFIIKKGRVLEMAVQ